MSKHRTRFEEEHQALCDLQGQYRRALSELAAWQRTENDRLSSVEGSLAEFQSSVERRLGLVESTSAAKSELAKYALKPDVETNCARKSDLEKCALKSDLQSNYATKSELTKYALKGDLQANYATVATVTKFAVRADLESNYATKSELAKYALTVDLETNYATKSDATSLEQRCASRAYVEEQLNHLKRVTGGFPLIPGCPLKGIIHHLTLECGWNVHDRGVVSITADRPYSDNPGFAAKNIADLEADSHFDCANAKDMWVCYDFKDMKVILTDYSIRSAYFEADRNLKAWVIEFSADGQNWTEADRRENREELHAKNVVRSFAVSKQAVGRYVRLRQIGVNHNGNCDTCTSGFELFGALTS
jgi:hypothetical protein